MNSASSFPETIIRRKAAADMLPSGKASLAAVSKRNGVSLVNASGAGVRMLPLIALRHPPIFRRGGKSTVSSKMNLS
jgi:hypothetical protein